MDLKCWLLAAVFCGVLGCGKPSASEMRDFLGKMSDAETETKSRKELIENIGYEPDVIEAAYGDCEAWIYKLSGGDVRLIVCEVDGVFYAQVREFGQPDEAKTKTE